MPAINTLLIAGHVTLLFLGAYLCHTALAARRPDPLYLTEFYFCIALGGALGGAFAAIIAPKMFSDILEYPLLVAMLPLRIGRISAGAVVEFLRLRDVVSHNESYVVLASPKRVS